MEPAQVEREIWRRVEELNRLWSVDGNVEGLREYFHKDMVAITPAGRERLVGREACMAGWKWFTDSAKIHYWKELEPLVQVYGGTSAVVTYYYDMSCEMGGQALRLTGRDMMTFCLEEGRWWLVADQFSPYPCA